MSDVNFFAAKNSLQQMGEIVDGLMLLLTDKEKIVVTKRYNLDGKGRVTLEEIGRDFAVTRERIRQIEKNGLSKMQRNVFNTPLKDLNSYVTSVVGESGGLVLTDKVIGSLKELAGTKNLHLSGINLAFSLNSDVLSVGNTIHYHPHLKSTDLSNYSVKYMSNKLVQQLKKYGDPKQLDRIHRDLKTDFTETKFNLLKVKSLIDIDKRLTLVSENKVALKSWRHINPRTLYDKILYILRDEHRPLHFNDIAKKIEEFNFDSKSVNFQAVHNELIRNQDFVLIGRGIYALKEWGYTKGTVSDVIDRILKEHKSLDQDQIVSLVLKKRQVKPITVSLALKNTNRFVRTGRRHYELAKK
jgi:DNA-binding PadR family transcriptional regulator